MKKVIIGIVFFLTLALGGCNFFEVKPIIVGKSPKITKKVFIFLHGYGAPRNDLEGISKLLLKSDPRWSFYLIPGPYSGGLFGYSYYSVRSGTSE